MAYNLSGYLYIKYGIGHIFVKISLFIVQKNKKNYPLLVKSYLKIQNIKADFHE